MSPLPVKLVIVICHVGFDNKVIIDERSHIPFGYHHILKIFDDDSRRLEVALHFEISEEAVKEVASMLANGLPVESNDDFYKK